MVSNQQMPPAAVRCMQGAFAGCQSVVKVLVAAAGVDQDLAANDGTTAVSKECNEQLRVVVLFVPWRSGAQFTIVKRDIAVTVLVSVAKMLLVVSLKQVYNCWYLAIYLIGPFSSLAHRRLDSYVRCVVAVSNSECMVMNTMLGWLATIPNLVVTGTVALHVSTCSTQGTTHASPKHCS